MEILVLDKRCPLNRVDRGLSVQSTMSRRMELAGRPSGERDRKNGREGNSGK